MTSIEDYAPSQVFQFSTKFLFDSGLLNKALSIVGPLPYGQTHVEISDMAMISLTGKQAHSLGLATKELQR